LADDAGDGIAGSASASDRKAGMLYCR
jgi:hypothetical protein